MNPSEQRLMQSQHLEVIEKFDGAVIGIIHCNTSKTNLDYEADIAAHQVFNTHKMWRWWKCCISTILNLDHSEQQ